ncbi:MAG: ChbG/HpnK family deacetylase [Acidobacteriota bacterium]|nr:ChbG/HpnK family deacetylase [Acidobacteriota bacterium]
MERRTFLQNSLAALPALNLFNQTGSKVRLITRGDDLGCTRSLNRATLECFKKGILKNVSVLAATPFVEEAAKMMAKEKGICFGLHCDLTSEWDNVKWGSVAPRKKVPSLLDGKGYLYQTNDGVRANAKADEALIELQAQLDKARKLGFDIRYADTHMGTVNVVPGLAEKFGEWCRQNRLIDTRRIGGRLKLPNASPADRKHPGDYVADVMNALKAATDGEYLIVGHLAFNDAEIRNLGHPGYPGEAVAHNLNWERLAYVDPRMVKFVRESGVQTIRYDETETGREQVKEFLN